MDTKKNHGGIRRLMRLRKFSLPVTLPKGILAELGWKEKQKVVAKKYGNGILIEDWKE
jgi:antitoxin component of MazEF toxin-antitoxin module